MLTEINALEITIKLFQDIYDNNYYCKSQSKHYLSFRYFKGACALCEYHKPFCKHCCLHTRSGCTSYNKWTRGDIEGAKEIVATCTERLNKLLDGGESC